MPPRIRLFFTAFNLMLALVVAAPILRYWNRISVERLWMPLGSAAMCGAMLMLAIVVATGRLAWRGETGPRP